jgi:Tfp pilus assembly protein PilX
MPARLQYTSALRSKQRGVALAVSLIMLLLLTVIGVTAMRSSIFESQMARNEEARIGAFERAQSIIDSVIDDVANMRGAEPGDTNCTAGHVPDCTTELIELDDDLTAEEHGDRSSAAVTYLSCLDSVPRRLNVSEDEFDSAQFQIEGRYDGVEAKQGRSTLAQGTLIIVRQGPQGACP